jgi:hypothetical protein
MHEVEPHCAVEGLPTLATSSREPLSLRTYSFRGFNLPLASEHPAFVNLFRLFVNGWKEKAPQIVRYPTFLLPDRQAGQSGRRRYGGSQNFEV